MNVDIPPWVAALAEEDLHFIRRFVLASGSLKALAGEYGVSYPTLRNRLDRLIAKVEAVERGTEDSPLQQTVRLLLADGKISAGTARDLLRAHKASVKNEEDE